MAVRPPWLSLAAVYGGALIIGATLDSFPATSAYLIGLRGLSDVQYGAIYLPQFVMSLAGAVLGGIVSRKRSLPGMFKLSLLCFVFSEAILIVCCTPSIALSAEQTEILLMLATGSFGFGFGWGGGPLNGLAASLFPNTANTAITSLHMFAGAGLTLAPFLFSAFAAKSHLVAGIVLIALLIGLVLLATMATVLPAGKEGGTKAGTQRKITADVVFWLIAGAALVYALVEAAFSNWAVIFVSRNLAMSSEVAASCLAVFWAGLTLGRLGASLLALKVRPIAFLIAQPVAMVITLLLVSSVSSPSAAIGAFGLAGLACSAYFPMLVGFSAEAHRNEVAWLASMLTAAYMMGVGLGSYAIGSLREMISMRAIYGYSTVLPIIAACLAFLSFRIRDTRGSRLQAHH